MRVNAEIRDLSYKKMIAPLILPIIIVPLLLLLFAAVGFGVPDLIPNRITIPVLIVGVVGYGVLTVWTGKKASSTYNSSWMTEEFDFVAFDGKLLVNGKPMHTNVYKSKKKIYVHDLGDDGKPLVASFYATIMGKDFDKLFEYIEENGVKKERELLPQVTGRGSFAAAVSLSKYRRY